MFSSMPKLPGVPAQALAYHSNTKNERLFHEYRRMQTRVRDFVLSRPNLVTLGEDPVVEHLLRVAAFDRLDIVAKRIAVSGVMITVMCVPRRIWSKADAKSRLFDLKREAASVGTRCVLVPQGWLKSETRAGVARAIAQGRRVSYARAHSDQVLQHLRRIRISTVVETANAIQGHDDPVSVVLRLVSEGLVHIDRSRPLTGDTIVSMVA